MTGETFSIKPKKGNIKVVLPLPEFCNTPDSFIEEFKDMPDVRVLMEDWWRSGAVVKLQTFLRNAVAPEDWDETNLKAAIKRFRPERKKRRKKKTPIDEVAADYGVPVEELKKMLSKLHKK